MRLSPVRFSYYLPQSSNCQFFNMELSSSAAAFALEDGCRQLGMSNAAAPELLKYLICSLKQGRLGLEQRCFPSQKLELLWSWLADNPQASCQAYPVLYIPKKTSWESMHQ